MGLFPNNTSLTLYQFGRLFTLFISLETPPLLLTKVFKFCLKVSHNKSAPKNGSVPDKASTTSD